MEDIMSARGGKILGPGLLAGVVILIIGFAVSYLFMLFPSVTADYYNSALIRPWSDPIMSLFFLYPFVLGLILAWVWDKIKAAIPGTGFNRGIKFGLGVWLVATAPGMLVSYSTFPLSFLTVLSWLVGGLINLIAAGLILSKLNK